MQIVTRLKLYYKFLLRQWDFTFAVPICFRLMRIDIASPGDLDGFGFELILSNMKLLDKFFRSAPFPADIVIFHSPISTR